MRWYFFSEKLVLAKKNTSTKSVIINRSTLRWVHYRRWILSIILTTWAGNLSFCGITILCDRIMLLLKGLRLSGLPLRCTLKDQNHMGQPTLGAIRNGLTKSDEMSWTLGVPLNEMRAAYYWKALDSWAREKIPYGNKKLHAESERDVKWIYVIHIHVMYVHYR